MVGELLNSPYYGKRRGRHWLDAAGYVDGKLDNDVGTIYPNNGIWRYRDCVIRVFNDDKLFHQFLRRCGMSVHRRLALPRWLTQPDHPLTASVFVNRVRLYHFGRLSTLQEGRTNHGARLRYSKLNDIAPGGPPKKPKR